MSREDHQVAPADAAPSRRVSLRVNGRPYRLDVEDRSLLVHVLRESMGLTGSHVGCVNGDCGACTVEVDGRIAKSCLVLAVAVDGSDVTTIEGLASADGRLSVLQEAFWDADAFQCGYCLPGHLFAARDLIDRESDPSEAQIREALIGNVCRCTGYVRFVDAIRAAARTSEAPPMSRPGARDR